MAEKLSLEERQKRVKNIILISEYYNKRTYINCRCEVCGYEFVANWSNLNRGDGCPKCARKRITAEERKTIIKNRGIDAEILEVYTKNRGKTVITKDTYCKCRCNIDGYVWDSLWGNLNKGEGCPKCSGSRVYTIKEIQEKLDASGLKVTVLDTRIEKVRSGKTKSFVELKCNIDGYEWKSQLSNVLGGKGCSLCSASKAEKAVYAALASNDIEFVFQWKHAGCKNKKPLPFDFYVPSKNTCIEIDGIQHYKPMIFGASDKTEDEAFEYVKTNDSIKNRFCAENNIELIRIPYFYTEKRVKSIINKALI